MSAQASAAAYAIASGAGGVKLPTPLLQTLTDDFASSVDKTTKWGSSTAGVAWDGVGQALVPCITPFPGNFLRTPVAGTGYKLTGSKIHAKPTVTPFGAGTRISQMVVHSVLAPTTNSIGISCDGTNISVFGQTGGGTILSATLAYSAVNHAWWRIREAGGSVFAELGADGVTFGVTLASGAVSAIWMDRVYAEFNSYYTGVDGGANMLVDNVNL